MGDIVASYFDNVGGNSKYINNFIEARTTEILNFFTLYSFDKDLLRKRIAKSYWDSIVEIAGLKGCYISGDMMNVFKKLNISMEYISIYSQREKIADYIIKTNPKAKKQSAKTREHVIPADIATSYILECAKDPNSLKSKIRELLENAPFCFICFEEDQRLRDLKLSKTMPNGIEDLKNKDWWARYKKANIQVFPLKPSKKKIEL